MVELAVTYMELKAAPQGEAFSASAQNLAIGREVPSANDYLALYQQIGEPFEWDSRLRMPPAALVAWLVAPSSDIYVLREDGAAIGLCEFDCVADDEIELVHFGIAPSAYGRGLGRYLLDYALRDCWRQRQPQRIWLHTDTNDHPSAIAVYTNAGFRPYLTRKEYFDD